MDFISSEPEKSYVISRAAFRFRLTDAEFIGILDAAKIDAGINSWMETFKLAQNIDLCDQNFQRGLDAMVSAGLLTIARVIEIVSTPASEAERP